jgi:hypothetical protein
MIDETLTAKASINILEENLLVFDRVEEMIFMQYLALCHRALKNSWCLSSHEIDVLAWFGNAPDMNLVDCVWS